MLLSKLKTKNKKIQITAIFSLVFLGVLFGFAALAQTATPSPTPSSNACTSSVSKIGPLELQVPILTYTKSTGIAEYIKEAYKASLYILVPIAIIIIIFSGFAWVTAGGDQGRISQAKQYISGAFWGLTLALLSYIILSFIGLGTIKDPTAEEIPCVTTSEFGYTETVPFVADAKGSDPSIVDDLEAISAAKNPTMKNAILANFIDETSGQEPKIINFWPRQINRVALAADESIAPEVNVEGVGFPVVKGDVDKISWNFGQARKDNLTGIDGGRCHGGVDIYTTGQGNVKAIASGKVIAILKDWYKPGGCTGGHIDAVFVQHGSYTVNYGEINMNLEAPGIKVGNGFTAGTSIGPATYCGMLHFELWSGKVTQNTRWYPPKGKTALYNDPNYCANNFISTKPTGLMDPTKTLEELYNNYLFP